MANVFNVARFILAELGPMSTWKLQKLCFYSQAWSWAWTENPLFAEDFEAWSNGPVCPILFSVHKGKFTVSIDDIPESYEGYPPLSEDQRDVIHRVLVTYGSWEPYDLREQTHSERPWKDARGDLEIGERGHAVISKDSIGEYYGSL